MKPFLIWLSKGSCLALFGLGAVQAIGPQVVLLPFDATRAALILLVIHVAELLFVFKHVRLYTGPLAMSVLLTLLFGLLHWKPLADAASAGAAAQENSHE